MNQWNVRDRMVSGLNRMVEKRSARINSSEYVLYRVTFRYRGWCCVKPREFLWKRICVHNLFLWSSANSHLSQRETQAGAHPHSHTYLAFSCTLASPLVCFSSQSFLPPSFPPPSLLHASSFHLLLHSSNKKIKSQKIKSQNIKFQSKKKTTKLYHCTLNLILGPSFVSTILSFPQTPPDPRK